MLVGTYFPDEARLLRESGHSGRFLLFWRAGPRSKPLNRVTFGQDLDAFSCDKASHWWKRHKAHDTKIFSRSSIYITYDDELPVEL